MEWRANFTVDPYFLIYKTEAGIDPAGWGQLQLWKSKPTYFLPYDGVTGSTQKKYLGEGMAGVCVCVCAKTQARFSLNAALLFPENKPHLPEPCPDSAL